MLDIYPDPAQPATDRESLSELSLLSRSHSLVHSAIPASLHEPLRPSPFGGPVEQAQGTGHVPLGYVLHIYFLLVFLFVSKEQKHPEGY